MACPVASAPLHLSRRCLCYIFYMDYTHIFQLHMWKLIEAQERENNAKREEARKEQKNANIPNDEDEDLETDLESPEWLEKYIKYKFDLLNRTGESRQMQDEFKNGWKYYINNYGFIYVRSGDGVIDIDEFEYVLSGFDISSRDARTAFIMMTQASYLF